jgi:hypothetical protein
VADGPAQTVKAEIVEVVTGPAPGLAGVEVSTLALHTQGTEPSPDVAVELVEALSGIPGAEVVAPTP